MKKNLSKRNVAIALSFLMVSALVSACLGPQKATSPSHADLVLVNQVGYAAQMPKTALVRCQAKSFDIIDSLGKTVFSSQVGEMKFWPQSGDSVALADFSPLTAPGTYFLKVNDTIVSYPITIAQKPFTEIAKASIKSLYFNRTAMAIDSAHGGKWARPAGHPDTVVYIHESAASKQRPAGSTVSSPGGWYDAGDYNKYVVNSGISTYTLLKALEDYAGYLEGQNLNIPETGNKLPDILDETLFNLRWVLTMQDPNDGGVYHKLTNKNFDPFVMPDKATEPRYMVMKTTAAALDFAALLAKASRVLKPYENQLPGLADSCMTMAVKAWQWAVKNPNLIYRQPDDVKTGTYGDDKLSDEWFWASCEMWLSTGTKEYADALVKNYSKWDVPTWDNVGLLGVFSLLKDETTKPSPIVTLQADFIALADQLLEQEKNSAYHVSIDKFAWGSNSDVVNQGMIKLIAYPTTHDKKYLESAVNDADYVLGRNATAYCFVTGFGSKQVMHIHHRPSSADGVPEPVPGFLAGGPNLVVLNDCGPDVKRSPFPAKSYVDEECSYSTNEIAINWNAPLAYLLNGLAAQAK